MARHLEPRIAGQGRNGYVSEAESASHKVWGDLVIPRYYGSPYLCKASGEC